MKTSLVGMDELLESSPKLGNKVKNLAVLAQAGIRVPRGFGIPYDVYTNHVASLKPALQQAWAQANNYTDMAKQFCEIIMSRPLGITNEILAALKAYMPNTHYFAVRSAGAPIINGCETAEDSAGMSFAGQYESFLLVPASNVPQAVLLCYASLFSERCLTQFKVKQDVSYLNSRMSVLIQEMYHADLSAVVMTHDPIEAEDYFGIEVTYGACEALVSGKVQGDLYLLNRLTGDLIDAQLGSKIVRIEYKPFINLMIDNKVTQLIPNELRIKYAASSELLTDIYNLSMSIERQFKTPQDIELVVVDGEIIITQARPITAYA